jgi:hypothetical protein
MPCDTVRLTDVQRAERREAIKALGAALAARKVRVRIGPSGSIAFQGEGPEGAAALAGIKRGGLADLCAYRRLLADNDPGLRAAVARAEAMAGRRVDARAIAAGVHSHDGGGTWGTH